MLGLPVSKGNYKRPFGYMQSQVVEKQWYPVDEELRLLYRAIQYYKRGKSVTEICDWIEYETGHKLLPQALYKIMQSRPPSKEIKLPLEEREKLFFTRNDI